MLESLTCLFNYLQSDCIEGMSNGSKELTVDSDMLAAAGEQKSSSVTAWGDV